MTPVCFLGSGVCSVMAVVRNVASVELGTVGNEGVTTHALTAQIRQSAARNRCILIEKRAYEWMLMTHNRVFVNEAPRILRRNFRGNR